MVALLGFNTILNSDSGAYTMEHTTQRDKQED